MRNRQISISILSVVLIQLDFVLGDWDRDFGGSYQYNNGGPFNNNYQPPYQQSGTSYNSYPPSYPNSPTIYPNPSTHPYYPYPLPTVISLDGNNNNNNGNKNNNYGNNDNSFNMLDFLSLWIGSQNNCPTYVPYPIPIPVPCMCDGDYPWPDVFNKGNWEEDGWYAGSSFIPNSDSSSGRGRKRGRSRRKGKSKKNGNSNKQQSQNSSNTKNRQASGKGQGTQSGKKAVKNKPQIISTDEYDDQQISATIQAGDNIVTISCSKPDKDYDYEDYSDEEEQCNESCGNKKVIRTHIVIETSR
ncbi:transcription factor mef2A-like [Amyelois transitella]|uniref:transcription factor mef2A-like n=1 Tax=Amyelois transitella TaxID=680683 RepID=UPI0029902D04|nr:transcription factor mef2A-like [Amyelois transitella]